MKCGSCAIQRWLDKEGGHETLRGVDYNTGLRGGLFEERHYQRMGAAIWLYGWLVLRQTNQHGSVGWVLGGKPVSYREVESETGFNCRTLERWMATLRRQGYIDTEVAPGGVVIRINKAKKFAQAARKMADGLRKAAEGGPQNCPKRASKYLSNEEYAAGIGSSSVERLKEKPRGEIHSKAHRHSNAESHDGQPLNPSCLGSTSRASEIPPEASGQPHPYVQFFAEARLRLQLLRAEREEAIKRELRVGTGPEIPHR